MRLAVVSDIHGNLAALCAVLDHMDTQQVDEGISLGDNVGYGADPSPVLRLLRDRKFLSVCGNHEAGLVSPQLRNRFNPHSREALELTRGWIEPGLLEMMATMEPVLLRWGYRFVHGMPPDSPFRYLYEFHDSRLPEVFRLFSEELCFIGHTHEPKLIRRDGEGHVMELPFVEGEHLLPQGCRHLVNVGSVGQPRDGDPRAKYVVWDTHARVLTLHCVAYDVDAAACRFREAGVPQRYIDKLY